MNETDASVAGVFVKRTVEDNPGGPEELPISTLSSSSSRGSHCEKRNVTVTEKYRRGCM